MSILHLTLDGPLSPVFLWTPRLPDTPCLLSVKMSCVPCCDLSARSLRALSLAGIPPLCTVSCAVIASNTQVTYSQISLTLVNQALCELCPRQRSSIDLSEYQCSALTGRTKPRSIGDILDFELFAECLMQNFSHASGRSHTREPACQQIMDEVLQMTYPERSNMDTRSRKVPTGRTT